MFWQQTPRLNQSTMLGVIERMRRDWISGLQQSRWAGFFAQVKLSEHEKLFKQLTAGKPKAVRMSGKQIALAMRAWVARSE